MIEAIFIDNIVKTPISDEEKEMLKQVAEELMTISKDPEVMELIESRNREFNSIELDSVYSTLSNTNKDTGTIKVECLKSRFGNDRMSKIFKFDEETGNYEEDIS